MPRSRSIKPGFFKNETLADLPPLTRLLFIGLWTIADRNGLIEYRPRKIKAEVFPYDSCQIDKMVSELELHGFVVCYEVDGEKYISIPTWHKHQSPHCKEPASTIPAPCESGASPVLAQEEHQSKTPDSGLLTADSGLLTPVRGLSPSLVSPTSELFDEFCAEYPGEVPANLWQKFGLWVNTPEDAALLRQNLPLWKVSPKYASGYAPRADKFLRDGLYKRAPPAEMQNGGTRQKSRTEQVFEEAAEILRRRNAQA